jgi:hypothetical protein
MGSSYTEDCLDGNHTACEAPIRCVCWCHGGFNDDTALSDLSPSPAKQEQQSAPKKEEG